MAHYYNKLALLWLVLASAHNVAQGHDDDHFMGRKLGKQDSNARPNYVKPTQQKEEKSHSSKGSAFDAKARRKFGVWVENVRANNHHDHHNHHYGLMDKSVVGAGVIFGGLGMTFLVAIFCYIRATARHKSEDLSLVHGSLTTTTNSSVHSSSSTV